MRRHPGVLALQGNFAKHQEMLESLGVTTRLIKKPEELADCDGLILPGGESTTLTKLLRLYGFYEPLRDFSRNFPIMGTCAGMILVASQVDDDRVKPLQIINIAVARNAYGRQIDSFITEIDAACLGNGASFRSIFIRAPQIQETGPEVDVLMEYGGRPVMVRNKNVLALAFHPELTNDSRIHRYFLEDF